MPVGLIWLVMMILLIGPADSSAKIYKFQKDGKWYFTDTPPADMPKDSQEMAESGKSALPSSGGGAVLLQHYPARNAIEKAAMATVAIKTTIGYGSGFFISGDGHIITNKHVVRMMKQQAQKIDEYFSQVDNQAETIEKQFAVEQRRLDDYRARLNELQKTAANEANPANKKSYEGESRFRKQEFEHWKTDFQKRKQAFQAQSSAWAWWWGNRIQLPIANGGQGP